MLPFYYRILRRAETSVGEEYSYHGSNVDGQIFYKAVSLKSDLELRTYLNVSLFRLYLYVPTNVQQ